MRVASSAQSGIENATAHAIPRTKRRVSGARHSMCDGSASRPPAMVVGRPDLRKKAMLPPPIVELHAAQLGCGAHWL
jgi:hypothetical protein